MQSILTCWENLLSNYKNVGRIWYQIIKMLGDFGTDYKMLGEFVTDYNMHIFIHYLIK